jgi:hypothetical protein
MNALISFFPVLDRIASNCSEATELSTLQDLPLKVKRYRREKELTAKIVECSVILVRMVLPYVAFAGGCFSLDCRRC